MENEVLIEEISDHSEHEINSGEGSRRGAQSPTDHSEHEINYEKGDPRGETPPTDLKLEQLANAIKNPRVKEKSEPFIVDCFYFENTGNRMEKVKKYFRRKKLMGHFDVQENNNENAENLTSFYKWLLKQRKTKKKTHSKHLGYINDQLYLYHNPVKTPPPPPEWDILCFNGNIEKYYYSDNKNNVYWCKADVISSNTFVLNFDNIDAIIEKVKVCIEKQEFVPLEKLFKLDFNIFIITQYYFTHNSVNSVEKNKSNIKDNLLRDTLKIGYYKQTNEFLSKLRNDCSIINYTEQDMADTFNKYNSYFNKHDNLLPTVSFVVPLTDPNTFWFNIMLFNKVKYTKKEMIIVDYLDLESKIKRLIQKDARFKLIKLSIPEDRKAKNDKIPMGYILNGAIQNAKDGIIVNCFDNNYYNEQNLNLIIVNFLMSNKECFIGSELFQLNLFNNKISKKEQEYNLSNFIFTKDFWRMYSFDELEDNHNALMYNFIKDRKNLTAFYPSGLFNMQFVLKQNQLENETETKFTSKELECFKIMKEVRLKK